MTLYANRNDIFALDTQTSSSVSMPSANFNAVFSFFRCIFVISFSALRRRVLSVYKLNAVR